MAMVEETVWHAFLRHSTDDEGDQSLIQGTCSSQGRNLGVRE